MRIVRLILRWLVPVVLAPVLLFLLAGWIGALIPRNSDWIEPNAADADTVTLFVGSNGIHTEIAMPITHDSPDWRLDWRDHFPLSDLAAPNRAYTHVAVSWGEKSFFLETPSWSEFDLMTGLGALTGGDALLHAVFYESPAASEQFRPIRIRREEYRALAMQIIADLPSKGTRTTYRGYGARDAFYDAKGAYHLANTCNQWTSDRLARAGIETGWWTPLPGGVMQWVPRPD